MPSKEVLRLEKSEASDVLTLDISVDNVDISLEITPRNAVFTAPAAAAAAAAPAAVAAVCALSAAVAAAERTEVFIVETSVLIVDRTLTEAAFALEATVANSVFVAYVFAKLVCSVDKEDAVEDDRLETAS
jgi:hypothetical protein